MTDNVDFYREEVGHDGKPREVRNCCEETGWEGVDGLKSERELITNVDVSVLWIV